MYQGDFSNWVDSKGALIKIYDPNTTRANPAGGFIRDPFPNNIIPQSRFSATSLNVLKYGGQVVPNRPGLVPGTPNYVRNNYVVNSGSTTTPTDKGSIKVDHNLTESHRLGFFYNRTSYSSEPGPGGAPGLPIPLYTGLLSQFDSAAYRMSYDWTISPRMLNHFTVGGNKFSKNSFSASSGGNWASKVCIKNAVDCNVNFPNVSFSEFSTWGRRRL